ncbi:MAG TPA: glycosyl transferase family 1 [Agrobacterium sp.]|nr:glycosyl transferase family 1 [Agrobacterium sp.]
MRLVLDLQACQASNRARGIGRYAMSLAIHIAQLAGGPGRNHDVRIVLNNRFPDSIDAIRHAFDGLVPHEHITVFDVPAHIAGADPANDWRTRAAERVREHYLADLRPDIVHVASLFEGWGDEAVSSIAHGPAGSGASAVTLYDLIPLVRQEAYLSNPRMRDWYYRKLQSLKSADLLLAISGYSRDEAISELHLPAERVVNISSAIDSTFGPRMLTSDAANALRHRYGLTRPFLMYTGGIDYRKNIEGLIEAFAGLPGAVRKNHQLAIVCNVGDADRERLVTLAGRCGLGHDALVLTGYVPDDDLVSLYNLATAFVFPSLHEGFGLPALEAMACGTPVIGSDASSIPEVIGRADALFDPTDKAAMSAKIEQVLVDEGFRTSLRAHGLVQARQSSWDASAERALSGFEQLHASRTAHASMIPSVRLAGTPARPRLAFLSPLPPDKSGIADYSADLIAELIGDYDIDVIAQSQVTDPWILANCRIRSINWFEQHGDSFDRIIYHFGNSSFHEHMFGLLARFPGVVVLHDFFLSGIVNHIDHIGLAPHALVHALYDSHGYAALIAQQREGRLASIWGYPCNYQVLNDAAGVIVHSRYAQQLAQAWYGAEAGKDWVVMPFPRALGQPDRQGARKRLGLDDEVFLTCSFGLLGPTKLNDKLLEAWLQTPMAKDPRCQLVFVGENEPGPYGQALKEAIAKSGHAKQIKITGFASRELYLDYLSATDSAVQLRGKSRGETSAAIMDCLAYGVPTVINANGSAAELPDTVLLKIDDEFTQAMLSDALTKLYKEPGHARDYSGQARNYLATQHHPHRVGRKYRDAIEQFCMGSPSANRRRLLGGIGRLEASATPAIDDWAAVARSVALNQAPPFGPRQLLVDVSELVQRDSKSGIQRVVRNILEALLNEPPPGYRVEPVYESGGQYWYARRFACDILGMSDMPLQDSLLETACGDRYLGLDLLPHIVPQNAGIYQDFRNRGVDVFFVVYDLLPVLRPDVFVPEADVNFGRWLDAVTTLADGVICISRAVADELVTWLEQRETRRQAPLKVGYFHLGADIPATSSNRDGDDQPNEVLSAMLGAPSILMVGTIEPRKAHAQALAAFERLWAEGTAVNLVIVGKQGWMVEALVERLRNHPEKGRRLFWIEGANDALLLRIYAAATALLAASEGEGFGLPLIEAAQHGLPIIARDLDVFKEVAGEHAFYFNGTAPEMLAARLAEWLSLHASGRVIESTSMPWLKWHESAQQLIRVISSDKWHACVTFENKQLS